MDSFLHKVTGPARSLLWHKLSMEEQPPSGIQLIQYGILHVLQLDLCSKIPFHGLQGDSLSYHVLTIDCRGITALTLDPLLPLLYH